jgi:hypothetical protein
MTRTLVTAAITAGSNGCALQALRTKQDEAGWALAGGTVFFADEATAVAARNRPCGICLPTKHREWKRAQKR